ncbi:hypothetical protein U9M48_037648 [Paspalum notatum var. saurae]|uniref:Glycine-rich protein n=1 Tax=Paspalum notatum var. saurae TaxID=547442 RepID=A0AAQ3XCM5_PASNO
MAAAGNPRSNRALLLLLAFLLFAAAPACSFAALDDHLDVVDDGASNNLLPAPAAGNKQPDDAEPSYYGGYGGYGAGAGFIPPGASIPIVPAASGGPGAGGGGWGWGAGYGGAGGYAHGGVEVPPPVVCQEKGPCYGKKLACPKRCFWSYSRSGNGYGAGGGGGSCTIDCTAKCTASC